MATTSRAPAWAAGLRAVLGRRRGAASDDAFDHRLIAPMILGSLSNPLNSTIIAVSLVPIGRAFGAPASDTVWLVTGLYLATAIGQPVVGRLVDTYGPRPLYLAGWVLTGIAGVLGMLAPTLLVLIVARIILGFGTCAGYPAALHLIRSEAERTGRNSPQGVLTALAVAAQTVAVVGPALGGLLIAVGGWRATFAVNVPLAAAGLYLGIRRLPRTTALSTERSAGRPQIDIAGIALFAVMLTSLLLFLMTPRASDAYLLVIGVVAGAGLVAREVRTGDPFIDVRMLAGNRPLVASYTRNVLSMTCAYAMLFGYPQWLEESRGLSPSAAGLILLPLFLVGIAVAIVTGRHPEIRGKLVVGVAFQLAGCALFLVLGPASPIWLLVAVCVVLGIPQGLNSLANQNAVYFQADPAHIGASAGLLRTTSYLGAIVASAASGAFFGRTADTAGLHEFAGFLLAVGAILMVLVLADGSLRTVGREGAPRAGRPATGVEAA